MEGQRLQEEGRGGEGQGPGARPQGTVWTLLTRWLWALGSEGPEAIAGGVSTSPSYPAQSRAVPPASAVTPRDFSIITLGTMLQDAVGTLGILDGEPRHFVTKSAGSVSH